MRCAGFFTQVFAPEVVAGAPELAIAADTFDEIQTGVTARDQQADVRAHHRRVPLFEVHALREGLADRGPGVPTSLFGTYVAEPAYQKALVFEPV